MKKLTLTSMFALCMACPAMADIGQNATSATCDSATIGTTSGDANLQAAWQANTINLDFYSDGVKVSTGTCSYDGAITLPSDPSPKTGYTFGGWKVRAAAAPAPTITSCNDIEDKTTCNQYRQYGCLWEPGNLAGDCYQSCYGAPEEWCATTSLCKWRYGECLYYKDPE